MKISAGILLFRKRSSIEFFLVHPGGPFWKNKDVGWWTIPKGEISASEEPLTAALREFEEETGLKVKGNPIQLNPIKQKAGKLVMAWAVEGDIDPLKIHSNSFEIEWPPRSGKMKSFPEVDKAGWFDLATAKIKILPAQVGLLEEVAGWGMVSGEW